MAKNLIAKYIWIVDTIERRGSISRDLLNELWMQSEFSDGNPLPRRSFYNYRAGIADTLGIDIEFNKSTYEYYIAHDGTVSSQFIGIHCVFKLPDDRSRRCEDGRNRNLVPAVFPQAFSNRFCPILQLAERHVRTADETELGLRIRFLPDDRV